jgi:hypothetical protein
VPCAHRHAGQAVAGLQPLQRRHEVAAALVQRRLEADGRAFFFGRAGQGGRFFCRADSPLQHLERSGGQRRRPARPHDLLHPLQRLQPFRVAMLGAG